MLIPPNPQILISEHDECSIVHTRYTLQVVSVLVAFALNRTQQELLQSYSDDDEEVRCLPKAACQAIAQPHPSLCISTAAARSYPGCLTESVS